MPPASSEVFRQFFKFSGNAEVPNRLKKVRQRWCLEDVFDGPLADLTVFDAIGYGAGRIRRWPKGITLRASSKRQVEDMPWYFCSRRPIVSDRLKRVFERSAPKQIQFLPIADIVFRGKSLDVGPYWVANPTVELDCVNLRKSIVDPPSSEHGGKRLALDLALHVRKVLGKTRVFVPKGITGWLVCDDVVRDAIIEAGCTGIWFGGLLGQERYERLL